MNGPNQPGGYPQPGAHPPPPHGAPPPFAAPPPYGGWPPPPKRGNGLLIALVIVLALLLVGGIVLALWFSGVFDRGSDPAKTTANAVIATVEPSPVGAPPSTATTVSCPGIVTAGAAGSGGGANANRVVVAGNGVTWNGTAIDPVELRQYLDLTRAMSPPPTLITSAAPGANPVVIQRVLQVIGQSAGCQPSRL